MIKKSIAGEVCTREEKEGEGRTECGRTKQREIPEKDRERLGIAKKDKEGKRKAEYEVGQNREEQGKGGQNKDGQGVTEEVGEVRGRQEGMEQAE